MLYITHSPSVSTRRGSWIPTIIVRIFGDSFSLKSNHARCVVLGKSRHDTDPEPQVGEEIRRLETQGGGRLGEVGDSSHSNVMCHLVRHLKDIMFPSYLSLTGKACFRETIIAAFQYNDHVQQAKLISTTETIR